MALSNPIRLNTGDIFDALRKYSLWRHDARGTVDHSRAMFDSIRAALDNIARGSMNV